MGNCIQTRKYQLIPMMPCKTINGVLKVKIQQAYISKIGSKFFELDPYLIIRLSNQQLRGHIHRKIGRESLFNQTFEFIINSCYKSSGRSMQIQVWDQSRLFKDKIMAIGTFDIDSILNTNIDNNVMSITSNDEQKNPVILKNHQFANKQEKQSQSQSFNSRQIPSKIFKQPFKTKIFLTNGVQEAGFVNVLINFAEQPIEIICFKFLCATLRRKSSLFTTMHCWIQVTAGQQILSTHKQVDKDTKNPPSWEDQILMFNIPKSLNSCIVKVFDEKIQVGRLKLSLREIIRSKGEHQFTQQIQHEQTVSGILKFTVLIGISSIIKQMKANEMKKQNKNINSFEKFRLIQNQAKVEPQSLQKQSKMQESYAKTAHYTSAHQQQQSKGQSLQNSRSILQNAGSILQKSRQILQKSRQKQNS